MVLSRIINFFYQDQCLVCGKTITNGTDTAIRKHIDKCFCESCKKQIPPIVSFEEKRCLKCSRTILSESSLCTYCRKKDYSFLSNISLWDYSDYHIRSAIHSFKFRDQKKAAYFFAEYINEVSEQFYPGFSIIPAPCSRKRLRIHGFDHMKLISDILEKKYRKKVFNIFRKKKSRDQKELGYEQRQLELKGKIILSAKKAEQCLAAGEKVIIIDDVFTTGATANYCAELLTGYGFKIIAIITLALD